MPWPLPWSSWRSWVLKIVWRVESGTKNVRLLKLYTGLFSGIGVSPCEWGRDSILEVMVSWNHLNAEIFFQVGRKELYLPPMKNLALLGGSGRIFIDRILKDCHWFVNSHFLVCSWWPFLGPQKDFLCITWPWAKPYRSSGCLRHGCHLYCKMHEQRHQKGSQMLFWVQAKKLISDLLGSLNSDVPEVVPSRPSRL